MAGLLPDVRGSGAGEARPRNLRLTAMLWQGDVLSPLLIFLLHLGELRLECLELLHQAREIVFVARLAAPRARALDRSEEHTSELQSLMRISYAVFCLKKKKTQTLHLLRELIYENNVPK